MTDLTGRPDDAALAAERSVVGAMLISEPAIRDVLDRGLTVDDLYEPALQTVFAEIVSVFMAGGQADAITVSNGLSAHGSLARVGGPTFLHDLISEVPTAANATYYATIVREAALKRRLAGVAARLSQAVASGADPSDVLAAGYAQLDELSNADGNRSTLMPVQDLFLDHLDSLERRATKDDSEGVRSHLADLHALTGTFEPGQLIVVGGRPGSGKTVFGLDTARYNAVARGKKTAVFSMEMSKQELMDRMLAAHCQVGYSHIRHGTLSDNDWARIAQRSEAFRDAPLWVDDSANLTPADLKAKARQLQASQGLDLVIVDYLQLMSSGARAQSRETEISAMSRQMKLMAKELGVPVVLLSQLNRKPDSREGGRPMVSDLRESGGIENDADVIILVHREEILDPESEHAGTALLTVGKQRAGSTGDVRCLFQGAYTRMVDMERHLEAA